jgi:hypothetical protein
LATNPLWSNIRALWTDSVATILGTRAAPTADTEGMDLSGCAGFRVVVSAVTGQTLDGTGTMKAWVYSTSLARWCRNPSLDFPITASGVSWTNVRDRASPDYEVSVRYGRVLFAPSSVGTSSGEPVTQVEAWQE